MGQQTIRPALPLYAAGLITSAGRCLAERLEPLDIDAAELAKALQGLGLGTAALLRAAA
jgi:hypothetical protein